MAKDLLPAHPNKGAVPSCRDASACTHQMQTRCTECGREQWAIAVYDVSHGQHSCVWCGQYNKVEDRRDDYVEPAHL